ncbi:hypothetical protein ACIGB8_01515 [Promicromonospora sukumoe]|uniref:hypothetical protein n=1 Tax=Promicromonospora sukumoe TaxID=88382 RepID=UPI0037C5ADBD
MAKDQDDTFVVVIVKEQDWRLLEYRLSTNSDQTTRINIDRDRFPNNRRRRICILVHDKRLIGLCLAGYQSTSGDVDHMAGLDHLRRFDPPIPAKRFVSRLQEQFRTDVANALQRGRLLDRRETREVAEELSRDALHLILLDELRSLAEELPRIDSDTARNRAEQRDAIAIALESVGLNSAKALPRTERDDEPNQLPFWNDIRTRPADEAASIRHDWSRMPDWVLRNHPEDHLAWMTFADPNSGKEKISIAYADKTELEHVTGTDLIYFRQHQPGFVLVQYKRMKSEPSGDVYRPDVQLRKQIRQMRDIVPTNPEWLHTVDDYRITPEPFFIKLVDSQVTRHENFRLADGMYFPLRLFESMLSSDKHLGTRRGTAIGRRNSPKHLSNDLFIQLLKNGWIGTAGNDTDAMTKLIKSLLDEPHGLVIAYDLRDPKDRRGGAL